MCPIAKGTEREEGYVAAENLELVGGTMHPQN